MKLIKLGYGLLLCSLLLGNQSHAINIQNCEVQEVQNQSEQLQTADIFYLAQANPWACQMIGGLDKVADVLVMSFAIVGTPATWEALGLASVSGTSIAVPLAVTAFVAGVGIASIKLTVMVTKEECFDETINEKVNSTVENYLGTNWAFKRL